MSSEQESEHSEDRNLINSQNQEGSSNKNNLIEIDNGARSTIFICLVLIAIFSSCDGGIIPQQNKNIKEDFGNDEKKIGLFGSIDYIGRAFAALLFSLIMGKMNRKMLLVGTLIFKAVTLFIPIFTPEYYINLILRCLSGISQVFYTTYLPVWCDQYGKKNQKAIMVTIVQVGNPIGIIIGYGIAMLCDVFCTSETFHAWRLAFFIEGIILVICGVIIFFFQNTYFSEKFVLIEDNLGKEEQPKETTNSNSLLNNIIAILCNKIFLFATLANSVAFFGIGVVQYYGDKYMGIVLGIENPYKFILFGALCLLGPTLGMVFGGVICSKLGGYVKLASMKFVVLSMLLAAIISCLIACHTNKVLFVITGLFYLFFIGASIPPESGIIISCLENRLRGDGFSLCNFILNLVGSFPSSYVYSIICDLFKKENEEIDEPDKYRYAWMISMLYNFIGLLFILLSGIFRCKIPGDLSSGEETKKHELKEEE